MKGNLQLKKIKFFGIKIYNLPIPRTSLKTSKLQKKPSALKKEHPKLQHMNFLHFFLLMWVIFVLLDPDPDSEYKYGSGYTDLIGSGSGSGRGSSSGPAGTSQEVSASACSPHLHLDSNTDSSYVGVTISALSFL
jgi:hypothetical protein